jgi:hypothetical protein
MSDKTRRFTVIHGGKAEMQRKKLLLLNAPWVFTYEEFDELCDHFGLSRAECFDLLVMRVAHRARTDDEAKAVLAVLIGEDEAVVSDLFAKARRNRFTLITASTRACDDAD